MFDCQTLVLLAFARLENGDRKGLQRCRDDFVRLIEKNPNNPRHQRLSAIVEALHAIQHQQFAEAVAAVRAVAASVQAPEFDFEAASNLLLMALWPTAPFSSMRWSRRWTRWDAFCTTRSLSELLAGPPPSTNLTQNACARPIPRS
jgi:hypothetical protein